MSERGTLLLRDTLGAVHVLFCLSLSLSWIFFLPFQPPAFFLSLSLSFLFCIVHHFYITIEIISQLAEFVFDFFRAKFSRQGFQRIGHTLHFKEDGASVRCNFVARFQLVDAQSILGQKRGDLVNNSGIVGTFQFKSPRI